MKNKGSIKAIELDPKRFKTLKKFIKKSGAESIYFILFLVIEPININFLSIDPLSTDYSKVFLKLFLLLGQIHIIGSFMFWQWNDK